MTNKKSSKKTKNKNMKKIFGIAILIGFSCMFSAQYMIVGKDSISLGEFKKEYVYGLQNNGIEKTISSAQDFLLLQQFAEQKKIDTMAFFREKVAEKENELRGKYFFPKEILDPVLNDYIKDNQTERKVQVFIIQKIDGDTNNYQQIYSDVKSGKIAMEDAISKYTKGDPKAIYIKPGSIDNKLYAELKTLPNNSLTKFYDTPSFIAFAKIINSRPSLGYIVFGTVSYPKDDNSEAIKTKIYNDLKAGKPFQEVAKLYGSNEHEKENGGIVTGSPTLPDEVYELFKGKQTGYYTPDALLYGESYFVFNIYDTEPYILTEKNKTFFQREMTSTLYAEVLQDKMTAYLKSNSSYKEFPEFQKVKKSYQDFNSTSDNAVLYQYKSYKTTVGNLKKIIEDRKSEAEKLPAPVWNEILSGVNSRDLMSFYRRDFANQKNIKKELDEYKKILYSDYVFSKYLGEEIEKHPEWISDYYNKNKSKYIWEKRADGRVAIIAEEKLTKEIEKEIEDPKKWENLKAKYQNKLNDKKQVLVYFEQGEMSEEADVFTKYKVPFKTGIHHTKMGERFLVIAIDKILQPTQMTQDEATAMLRDTVSEEKLKEIITQQKLKTNIQIQPEFMRDLEKNFKK